MNYTDDFQKEFEYEISHLKAFSGYLLNHNKLLESSSGGMATAISEGIIKNGGVVFGVRYSDNYKSAEYCMIDKCEDLDVLKGSKYISSNKMGIYNGKKMMVFEAVAEQLALAKKVLFIGLGCDVGALKSYCMKHDIDMTHLFTIDLICYGTTYPDVARQFLERLERQYKSKIKNYTVRWKEKGWTPFIFRAVFESGHIYERPFDDTQYGQAFKVYPQRRCFDCKFKKEQHMADLTIGDYWGCSKDDEEYNEFGMSIAIVSDNYRGGELIKFIDEKEFCLMETDICRVIKGNPYYSWKREKLSFYEEFDSNFKKRGLYYAFFIRRVKELIHKYMHFFSI